MRRRHGDHDARLADRHRADPVGDRAARARPSRGDLVRDLPHRLQRHRRVGFIFEMERALAARPLARRADEHQRGAVFRHDHPGQHRVRVERLPGQKKTAVLRRETIARRLRRAAGYRGQERQLVAVSQRLVVGRVFLVARHERRPDQPGVGRAAFGEQFLQLSGRHAFFGRRYADLASAQSFREPGEQADRPLLFHVVNPAESMCWIWNSIS